MIMTDNNQYAVVAHVVGSRLNVMSNDQTKLIVLNYSEIVSPINGSISYELEGLFIETSYIDENGRMRIDVRDLLQSDYLTFFGIKEIFFLALNKLELKLSKEQMKLENLENLFFNLEF